MKICLAMSLAFLSADSKNHATTIAADLATPIKVLAGTSPIDVEIGHAAPFLADFDGDGLDDLLVGQFGGGKLRMYKNVGSKGRPRFDSFAYLTVAGHSTAAGNALDFVRRALSTSVGITDATVPFG